MNLHSTTSYDNAAGAYVVLYCDPDTGRLARRETLGAKGRTLLDMGEGINKPPEASGWDLKGFPLSRRSLSLMGMV